jgi:hypothetical protein
LPHFACLSSQKSPAVIDSFLDVRQQHPIPSSPCKISLNLSRRASSQIRKIHESRIVAAIGVVAASREAKSNEQPSEGAAVRKRQNAACVLNAARPPPASTVHSALSQSIAEQREREVAILQRTQETIIERAQETFEEKHKAQIHEMKQLQVTCRV